MISRPGLTITRALRLMLKQMQFPFTAFQSLVFLKTLQCSFAFCLLIVTNSVFKMGVLLLANR